MSKHLKILILEDNEEDALLTLAELKGEWYSIAHLLINTSSNFKRELELSL
jgi:hypothetical protein